MARLVLCILPLVIFFLQAQHLCLVDALQTLRFLALGDWGGLPFKYTNYSTTVQKGVADGMSTLADVEPQSFVIALGDNFYFTGVDDVDDKRFYETFEKVFDASSLQIPWHLCAGNHDHYGNVSGEIAYTNKSERWNFPFYYHTKTWAIPDSSSTVQVVLIDTIILCGKPESDQSEDQPKLDPRYKKMSDVHWRWIKHTLKNSAADYLLVGGHYPVWSAGTHGNTDCLVEKLKPLLEENGVTAYLAGHDHNNQHIDEGLGVQYFVTGCATFAQYCPQNKDDVPEDSLKFFWADATMLGGFMSFVATPTEMTATFMAGTGEEFHEVVMEPRHNAVAMV